MVTLLPSDINCRASLSLKEANPPRRGCAGPIITTLLMLQRCVEILKLTQVKLCGVVRAEPLNTIGFSSEVANYAIPTFFSIR